MARSPVAIVGIGCRLPGGIQTPKQFWEFLTGEGDAIRDVPADRWDANALYSPDPATPGKTYARRGGFLDQVDLFDPTFFGISPREAAQMDPQQRLLLETAHEAMEDAGERWDDPAVRSTGVFVGMFIHDYQHIQFGDRDRLNPHSGTGTSMSIAANRVSYAFDLQGPSVAVDTACSSSLVAIDMACKALLDGDCDYALAGGVNLILKPENTIAMSKATMLSEDGSCKAFDAAANGYVRGEGAALVLLRRLSSAQAARNRIYATIRGSGVNSDGRTKGISVPNGDAQEALSRRVLAEAGLRPETVDYVEAHGTGTPVGDPIEVNALGRVFSEGRPEGQVCLIGSVKTNIGHLESASGAAGLIKAALCLKHGAIPPNLHFNEPNPGFDLDELKLRVVVDNEWWPETDSPRRVAVNSFGFGGTNAHVLLQEAPEAETETLVPPPEQTRLILPLGAHEPDALRELARGYADRLPEEEGAVQDFFYTVSQRRLHGRHRAAVVAPDLAEMRARLLALAEGKTPVDSGVGEVLEGFSGRPVFVFSGMGPQWWGMGRELLENESIFRREVERVDEVLRPLAGWSVMEALSADESASRVQDTNVAQPCIFAVQAGLNALWRAWGVEPAATMGHSVGEVAALYAAGILTLEDAVRVSYHRSRLQHRTAGSGGMLAAAIDLEAATELIRGAEDSVAIAAINGPTSLTLSGDTAVLERLHEHLEAEGTFARMLQVEVPYHSPEMDRIRDDLLECLAGLQPREGGCAYYSTVDERGTASPVGDADYWWRNVRQSVQFARAVGDAAEDGQLCFLEIGPHPVLRASIQECLGHHKVKGATVSSLRRDRSDFDTLFAGLAELHSAGAKIAWDRIIGTGRICELPLYPWQRSSYWAESKEAEAHRKGLAARHLLLGKPMDLPTPTWVQTLRLSEHPWLSDHKVQGAVVFPGTGYLEIALQTLADPERAGGDEPDDGEYLLLSDVEIGRALYLEEGEEVRLETSRSGERWSIHGSAGGDDGTWLQHVTGRARREKDGRPHPILDVEAVKQRCDKPLAPDYAYRLFRDVGLEYGSTFQAIQELWYGPQESLARLELPAGLAAPEESGFLFHPALFDACLHTLFGALNLNGEDSDRRGNVFLPVSVRQLRVYRRQPTKLWSHARLHGRSDQHFDANIRVYDDQGHLVAEVLDLRCQALEHPSNVARKRLQEWLFEYEWEEGASAESSKGLAGAPWLVLAPDADHEAVIAVREAGAECIVAVPGENFTREGDVYSVSTTSAADFDRLWADVRERHGAVAGIVHALCLGTDEPGEAPDLWTTEETGACSLLHLVQALTRSGLAEPGEKDSPPHEDPEPRKEEDPQEETEPSETAPPPVWILTDTTQPVLPASPVKLAHSTVWGLRRVIANEYPELSVRIVDLDGTPESLTAAAGELTLAAEEDELGFREGVRFVHRLRRHVPEEAAVEEPSGSAAAVVRMELEVPKVGDLKSMRWIELPEPQLGDFEVEIEVQATGVNFKDVLKAAGLFPARLMAGNLWSHDTLGMECAGRISRVGRAVTNVSPGDEVMAMAPRSFASHAVTHCSYVQPNPCATAAEGACVPVAFVTASVGLEHMARLEAGEGVLIHAATGGVGQAAIQVARDIGAEIFATAGSPEKRQRLKELGVEHIFDSRSLHFAEEIREATGGEGVDVILNSLAGDAITQGVGVLSDYGRFVEIGKLDLDRDFSLGLRPFTRCLSFHSVDLDRMLAQRRELCARVFESVHARLVEGRFRPVPVKTYDTSDAADAYQLMASAGHMGKLAVEISPSSVSVQASGGTRFRSDASYLVSGGLGGFGMQLAAWLAERGAGRIVLLGRRGEATPGAAASRERLEALGAQVQIEACDVADATDLRRALARIPESHPLRGVFHAAAVLDDALIENLDVERYRTTFGPKVLGAWNLHAETEEADLDHFMCFSSMASIMGNQGSGNYCAANAFVDALAHHRRARGLAALTVNWGVIADVGMAADYDFYRQNLERNGVQTIHSTHCLELLDLLMRTERIQTTVCPLDFEVWIRFNPAGREGRLREMLSSRDSGRGKRAQAAEELALREKLEPLSEDERAQLVQRTVQDVLAEVFRTPAEKVDVSRSLTALGADSLMAIEIKNRLEALGLDLSVSQLLNRNSVATLGAQLLEVLDYGEGQAEVSVAEPEPSSWLVRHHPREEAKLRLFCFPYAGGGTSIYTRWSALLPEWIEVVCVSLPGRGVRGEEANLESIPLSADAIVPEMLPFLDRPFALFGHCMGAIMMYEVAQRLQAEGRPQPVHIFASGCMAPHLYNSPIVHEQDDDSFLEVLRLISFSGTEALIEDPELRKTTYPLLRSDFRAVAEYGSSLAPRAPLKAPITGLAASNDLFAAPKAMEAWGGHTASRYELARLQGDHYFIESDRDTVIAIISSRIAESLGEEFEGAPPSGVEWSEPGASSLGLPPRRVPKRATPTKRTLAPADGPTRVLCFPSAGLYADDFPVPQSDDPDIRYELIEWRRQNGGEPIRSVREIVDFVYPQLGDLSQRTVYYGHCLGAAVAYELALRLQQHGRLMPEHLVVAGVIGPHLWVAPNAHELPSEKLVELLTVVRHPWADRLRSDRRFLSEHMPVIRADLEAMATYEYQPGEPLRVPITAISLRHDLWSYPLRTDTWKHHTEERCRVVEWDGDHYVPLRHPARLHEEIRCLLSGPVSVQQSA